tara:strand:+ start:362 stop:601 length:240 start_codon:yes stop_codon:yes gene_type:complete
MRQTFKPERLIAREDQERFLTQDQEEQTSQNNNGAGGDSTLLLKNTFKSLKALSADNDRVFAILDDRRDVWEMKDKSVP